MSSGVGMTRAAAGLCLAVICCQGSLPAAAQTTYGNRLGSLAGERRVYLASGPTIDLTALDPTVQRWYLPQELFSEYGRQQWEYTNYARERYRRYSLPLQEGQHFYDLFGDLITQGWLIYDWRQAQPLSFESSEVSKGQRYAGWFQRLVVSSDAARDYSYAITIGDEINTTLTPMTFSKAGFNGVVLSMATSRIRATGLFSRVSAPKILIAPGSPTESQSNSTNLAAGRLEADLGGVLTLGLTLVNAHNTNGSRKSFDGNPLTGHLTSGQLGRRQNLLALRISDDSPEDGEGGAALFAADVEITTSIPRQVAVGDSFVSVAKDTVLLGSDLGFEPTRSGGTVRQGFLSADGSEEITLTYVLAPEELAGEEGTLRLKLQQGLGMSLSQAEDAITNIENVRFRLILANDYRVGVASDRQTSATGQPQFLTVTRAPGNIVNSTNQREVVFDFGLPTASQVYGLSAEVRDLGGFDFYGEFNINNQFRKYPGIGKGDRRALSGIVGERRAIGWMANLSRRQGPWQLFAEAFGMDHNYTTDILLVDGRGITDYSPEASVLLYDFVDDNDDNDRHPDQLRLFQGSLIPVPGEENRSVRVQGRADPEVFPGYDENGDFISDFNQNNNGDRESFFPDYEEPFLRYYSDRPEFLFGIDLNNNGSIDRFENDDLPDYPYKRDRWGYNAFGRAQLGPGIRLRFGRLQEEMRSADRQNRTNYGILTFDRSSARWGRVRVFDMLKEARDTIPDPLTQWTLPETRFGQPASTSGFHRAVPDHLPAADTWINTFYTDWELSSASGQFNGDGSWSTRHRFKWERLAQRHSEQQSVRDVITGDLQVIDPLGPDARNGRRTSGFVGLIDKLDYALPWRAFTFSPMFKSELLNAVPFSRTEEKRRSWDAVLISMVSIDLLRRSSLQVGLERRFFYDLMETETDIEAGGLTGDFTGSVLALQLTNNSDYVGYNLTTQLGIRYDRRHLQVRGGAADKRTSGLAFLTAFAGL